MTLTKKQRPANTNIETTYGLRVFDSLAAIESAPVAKDTKIPAMPIARSIRAKVS